MSATRYSSDYARVERAILFIQAHAREQPGLGEVAAAVGLSEYHFQRLFQRWAGISPKRFLQVLTLQEAKRLLTETRSVLDASLGVGLSGPGRLHDLFLKLEQMTPGEYKARAEGLTIQWGVDETPFGRALFAVVHHSLCALSFLGEGGEDEALQALRRRWERANLVRDPRAIASHAAALRARARGERVEPLSVLLKGTPLQLRVWEALLRIPPGRVAAYGEIARLAGAPSAARAVGTAIGQNPIGYLIPCHRVIHASGALGSYHWGAERKWAMQALERAQPATSAR